MAVKMKLKILHTNDIHSSYENFSRIVSKIEELRDENTLLLDAGDFADFKRIELQGTKGEAALELLKYAGYDAISIGNNETFNGIDTLINMGVKSVVPFLSCNLYDIGLKDIRGVKRSIIVNKNGVRILIIGASPSLGAFNGLLGFQLKDAAEAVREEISLHKGQYDLCIFLSHLGMDEDKSMAEAVEGIDVIIGGHSHILMDKPEIINNKIIHTSGSFGENLGLLKIEIENGKVRLLEAENINTGECEPCEKAMCILKENKEKAVENLGKPLYYIDMDLWHDVVEENPITNLLADALADVYNCDLSIINSGVVNGGIRKGAVSNKKLLEICPSPLNPSCFEIQGKYLKEALQNSLDSDFCYMDGRGPGFRGKYLGRLHVSKVLIEHNGRKIINIFIKGEKLEEDKWYTVASSDYLQRGTGYSSLKNNRNEKYKIEYLRDVLREYISKKEVVEKAVNDRWILK